MIYKSEKCNENIINIWVRPLGKTSYYAQILKEINDSAFQNVI